jgi:hypothetical protein
MKLQDREDFKWAKYRWEFMRRNPKAIKNLSAALQKKGISLGEWLMLPVRMIDSLDSKVGKLFRKTKWTTELSFDEILEKIREIDSGKVGEVLAHSLVKTPAVTYDFSRTNLKIEIDLKGVYSVVALKKEVSRRIENYFSLATKMEYITPKKKPNLSISQFDLILMAGDLKRDGKKDNEIAKTINARKYKKDPDNATRLVRHMNKRYKQFVDEAGFANFTYL